MVSTLRVHIVINVVLNTAYSPLTRGKRLNDPALLPIAKEYGKTVAQILIRYTLQKAHRPLI